MTNEAPCRCLAIQAADPRRHFKGCPRRGDLPEADQAAINEGHRQLTSDPIDALEALRNAGTSGLWRAGAHPHEITTGTADFRFALVATCARESDRVLIVAAVNALPGLITELRATRAALASLLDGKTVAAGEPLAVCYSLDGANDWRPISSGGDIMADLRRQYGLQQALDAAREAGK